MEGRGRWCVAFFAGALLLLACAGAQEKTRHRVIGRAVDENGKGIGGVAIAVIDTRGQVDTNAVLANPDATSADDGSFSAEVDADELLPRLLFAIAGRQAMSVAVQPQYTPSGVSDLGEFVLPVGANLIGRVRDENGNPLGGVHVRVMSALGLSPSLQQHLLSGAVSTNDGIFRVPCTPMTGMRIRVTSPDHYGIERVVAQSSPLDLQLTRADVASGGVVDADGTPLAGAYVYVTADNWHNHLAASATTDHDGTFKVAVPPDNECYRINCTTRKPPYRQFRSGLLRGPATGMTLEAGGDDDDGLLELTVRVVDAETKEPIVSFEAAPAFGDLSQLQFVLYHAESRLTRYTEAERVPIDADQYKGLVVKAAGHAFAVVPLPADDSEPLVVELGPEAVITGIVTDEDTGKPMAGVPVRALPKGRTHGSGPVADNCPISDAKGRYRIGGLQPGEYGVQAHAADRRASRPAFVTTTTDNEATANLSVPKLLLLQVDVEGTLPAGPRPQLRVDQTMSTARLNNDDAGYFEHSIPRPVPQAVSKTGRLTFAPLAREEVRLEAFLPSRTRIAEGTTIQLGQFRCGKQPLQCELPDLTTLIIKGSVKPSQAIPFEYVALMATRNGDPGGRWSHFFRNPRIAGLRSDGQFTIDLPVGKYHLQLADVRTGIVFHTETELYEPDTQQLILRPTIHLLEVALEPKRAGDRMAGCSLQVRLPRPVGDLQAFLELSSGTNDYETSHVGPSLDLVDRPWIVPPVEIDVIAQVYNSALAPNNGRHKPRNVDAAVLTISKPNHRIVLKIPPPPTDEELQKK